MKYPHEQIKKKDIAYNYEALIKEVEEEISISSLSPEDHIQVLRKQNHFMPHAMIYRPIVFWYYNHENMVEILKDCPQKYQQDYADDQPFLEPMKVRDFLKEITCVNQQNERKNKSNLVTFFVRAKEMRKVTNSLFRL